MSNEDRDFSPLVGHDASAAIRGFFYQINVTILRWLELPAGHHLELEAGEDVDVVRDILMSDDQRYRELEQIKDLKTHVTIRSPEVLAPLARFLAHQRSNPGFHLEFRYLTTASAGRERPSDCGEPLITYWSELRKNNRPQESICFRQLRAILADAPHPDGVTEGDWQAFSSFFSSASDELVAAFIHNVRWDLEQSDSAGLRSNYSGP